MKTFALICISLCCATPVLAQETAFDNEEMQKALKQTEQNIRQSVENMNTTIDQVIPQLAEGMNKSLTDIIETFPELFSSMEENRVFSKTSEQMLNELKNSLDEMQISAENYKIENFNNKLSLSGSQNQNNIGLDFLITQDPMTIALTREYLDNKKSQTQDSLSVSTLSGEKITLKEFTTEKINGNLFLCYDKQDYTFIIGNMGYDANVKLETRGKGHKKQARDFIKTLNPQQLK